MAAFDAAQRRAVRNGRPDPIAGHPSTAERLRLLESAPRVEPAVRVTSERWAAVDQEMAVPIAQQLKRLADDFRHAR
jgi:hypothetical protein